MAKKDTTTPLLLGAGALAAVYFLTRKAKAATTVPDVTGDIDISEPTDTPPTDPPKPGAPKKDAPYFNPNLQMAEVGVVQGAWDMWRLAVGEAMAELGEPEGSPSAAALELAKSNAGIPKKQKVYENLADDGLFELYGVKTIPGNQGTGWQPFIDAWFRMNNFAKGVPWTAA
jgi:hypothetical protein